METPLDPMEVISTGNIMKTIKYASERTPGSAEDLGYEIGLSTEFTRSVDLSSAAREQYSSQMP